MMNDSGKMGCIFQVARETGVNEEDLLHPVG